MKLRTKFQDEDFELGEIVDIALTATSDDYIQIWAITKRGGLHPYFYKPKSKFDAEWEDASEEPKGYWAIDCFSPDGELVSQFGKCSERIIENRKQIGNHFSSREETELAVRRLEAWTRLKEKGFEFDGIDFSRRTIKFKVPSSFFNGEENIFVSEQSDTDLKFLFGGEE